MTEPAALLGQIRKIAGKSQLIIENPQATPEQDRQMYRQLLVRVGRKGALCRALIRQERPDIVAVVFGESHSAGHQFWKYRKAPTKPNGDSCELVNATRSIYEAIDHEMGLLLRELPPDADIFVLSSVGLTDHYPTGRLLESFCRELGYQAAAGNGASSSLHPMKLARHLVPERWRIGLSRHFSRETRERLLAEQFRNGTDWNRTTAFVIPSLYTGFIRINVRGREPCGIVEPGQDYRSILNRLEADLAKLIDPVTGKPAIEKVIRTAEVFGKDAPSMMPDLIIHWASCNHFVERVIHPKCELIQNPSEFNRDSDHYEHGFMAAAGSAFTPGRLPEIDILDLAPTFLRLLGEPQPPSMTGRPAPGLIQG